MHLKLKLKKKKKLARENMRWWQRDQICEEKNS